MRHTRVRSQQILSFALLLALSGCAVRPTISPTATPIPSPVPSHTPTTAPTATIPPSPTATAITQFHQTDVDALAYSLDGTELTLTTGNTIIFYNLNPLSLRKVIEAETDVWSIAWSPSGEHLASSGRDGIVQIWEVSSSEQINRFAFDTEWAYHAAWTSDGMYFAISTNRDLIRIYDATTWDVIRSIDPTPTWTAITAMAWSPDGQWLAGGDWLTRLWNTDTWEMTSLGNPDPGIWITDLGWSPDSLYVASAESEGMIRIWNAETGEELTALAGHTKEVDTIAWSPNGKWLASGDGNGEIYLWDTSTWNRMTSFHENDSWIRSLAWSPDSKQLASTSADGTVTLHDMSEQ